MSETTISSPREALEWRLGRGRRRRTKYVMIRFCTQRVDSMCADMLRDQRECNKSRAEESPYYKVFPTPHRGNIWPTDNAGANAGLINPGVVCYLNAIFQVIASCIHLTDFLHDPPKDKHQHFNLYYKFNLWFVPWSATNRMLSILPSLLLFLCLVIHNSKHKVHIVTLYHWIHKLIYI